MLNDEIYTKIKALQSELETAPHNRRMILQAEYNNLMSVLKIMGLTFAPNCILQKRGDGRVIPNV